MGAAFSFDTAQTTNNDDAGHDMEDALASGDDEELVALMAVPQPAAPVSRPGGPVVVLGSSVAYGCVQFWPVDILKRDHGQHH